MAAAAQETILRAGTVTNTTPLEYIPSVRAIDCDNPHTQCFVKTGVAQSGSMATCDQCPRMMCRWCKLHMHRCVGCEQTLCLDCYHPRHADHEPSHQWGRMPVGAEDD